MKFNGEIMHFHPSSNDRLLGFNQSGELWAVVGKIEFSNTRPLEGYVRVYGDDECKITTIGGTRSERSRYEKYSRYRNPSSRPL